MRRIVIIVVLTQSFFFAQLLHAEGRLGLNACIETALRNHPSIKAATGGVDVSSAQETQALAPYFPQIRGSTGYSRSHSQGALESITRGYTTTLSATQLVYDFGRTGNSLDAAQAGLRMAEWERERTVQEVILNVKQAYFALLQAEKLVAVARKTLEQAESHLKQAEAFYRAGSKPRFDVTRAEVEVNSGRLEVINAKNNVRLSRIGLNNAMGAPPAAEIEIEDILSAPVAVPTFEAAQGEALKNRPELRKAEAGIDSARARVRAEQSLYFPNISASGSYSWSDGTSEMGMYQGDLGRSWNAGVTLSLPLFEGGLTRGRVSEARANLLMLEAQRDALKQTVLLDVNRAYADLESAAARLDVMESSLKKARENLDIAQGRYQAGIGPYIEVTDAQLAAVKAETDYVKAQYDYQLAAASLEKAMGTIENSKLKMQSAK